MFLSNIPDLIKTQHLKDNQMNTGCEKTKHKWNSSLRQAAPSFTKLSKVGQKALVQVQGWDET